jgi:hypothetical protein
MRNARYTEGASEREGEREVESRLTLQSINERINKIKMMLKASNHRSPEMQQHRVTNTTNKVGSSRERERGKSTMLTESNHTIRN